MAQDQANATSYFNADGMTAAQEAPTLTVGGYLYRGRLLSIVEWLPWWERLQAIQAARAEAKRDGNVDDRGKHFRALNAFYRDYLRAVFPSRRYRWWAPDPVKHLMTQPFSVIEASIACFFFLQIRATFGAEATTDLQQTLSDLLGINSPPATASEPGAP